MIRIQFGNYTYTVDSAGDVLALIRQYIQPTHPVTINTFEDEQGTLIVVSEVEAQPTISSARKPKK